MTLKESGFAPVNGLQMYYEIYGNGNPLILVHGGGSTIESNWSRMIPLLSRTRQVIAVEMQAHGRTADIDRDFTFEQDADDIAAIIRYFKIPKADIFGFSNGGQTTLQVAVRHPSLVKRTVVASASFKRDGFQSWFWPAMKNATVDNMPPLLKDAFLKVTPDNERFLKMFHRDANRMMSFQGWSNEMIGSIKSPAFVVAGDNDVITVEHATEIYRLIHGSRMAILPGGHGDYLGEITTGNNDSTLHEAFVNMVLAFLDERS
jgi:pimeloyl-ACP methyl ester carboxylesterase